MKNPTAKAIWGTNQGHETTKPNRQCRKRQQWQSQARQKSTKNNVKTPSTFSNDAGRPQEQFFPSSEPTEEEPNRQRRLSPCKGYKPSADTKRQRKTHKSSNFFWVLGYTASATNPTASAVRATGTQAKKGHEATKPSRQWEGDTEERSPRDRKTRTRDFSQRIARIITGGETVAHGERREAATAKRTREKLITLSLRQDGDCAVCNFDIPHSPQKNPARKLTRACVEKVEGYKLDVEDGWPRLTRTEPLLAVAARSAAVLDRLRHLGETLRTSPAGWPGRKITNRADMQDESTKTHYQNIAKAAQAARDAGLQILRIRQHDPVLQDLRRTRLAAKRRLRDWQPAPPPHRQSA